MDNFIIWTPGATLESIEKQVILKAFEHYRQNKTQTARALDISIRTLETRLESYKADEESRKADDAKRKADREHQLMRARGLVPPTHQNADDESVGEVREDSAEAQARLLLQPDPSIPPQQPVPLPQRSEVQEMLPSKAAAGGTRGRR